jgi:hypothetical protein
MVSLGFRGRWRDVVKCGSVPKATKKEADAKVASAVDAETQLAGFLAKFSPEVEALAKALRRKLRARLKGANELVYDNYNALAIGYAPAEKASEAIFSIALYPRWVSFFFLQAKGLKDPAGVLRGSGNVARHIVLEKAAELEEPEIQDLIEQALRLAKAPLNPRAKGRLIIKSVSAKQRPRRAQS